MIWLKILNKNLVFLLKCSNFVGFESYHLVRRALEASIDVYLTRKKSEVNRGRGRGDRAF